MNPWKQTFNIEKNSSIEFGSGEYGTRYLNAKEFVLKVSLNIAYYQYIIQVSTKIIHNSAHIGWVYLISPWVYIINM